jgi:hypothetical protein
VLGICDRVSGTICTGLSSNLNSPDLCFRAARIIGVSCSHLKAR